MRLTNQQSRIIRQVVNEVFGPDAKVYLFGSRVDDGAKGGDIDLFVELSKSMEDKLGKTLQIVAELQILLGDQKIDLITCDPTTKMASIHEHARKNGVLIK